MGKSKKHSMFIDGMDLLNSTYSCELYWTLKAKFRIDNNDHVIDVNKGNLQFEYDQVHIICPYYEPGTNENETEKYIIYNVSKVEYETCRITNPNPRIIAICDKPFNTTLVTISFRPFTPQPGGLEFKPGNDYYFISTSSRDDLHRRIGGRCSSSNTKVIFKVFGGNDAAKTTTEPPSPISNDRPPRIDTWPSTAWKNHHNDDASSASDSTNSDSDLVIKPNESSNKNFNINNGFGYPSTQRPIYVNRDNHSNNINSNNNNGGNNINKPTKKTNEYDSRQNEVVKNEELTYNNQSTRLQSYTPLIALTSLVIILMRNGRSS
ncbi:CLUMA_CG020545, isoform A [Clunio marinus]|uniref:CLUMA_CG020545, isoform A n=1 Tax=Clunio marinus TaxID=568069 RepID=A0A1J1J720_9DIPT|nr:CLUMA_CG020545, isoform A [Clunio marinus]